MRGSESYDPKFGNMKRQAKISNPASHSSFVLSPFSAYFDTAISLFLFVVSSKSPKFWELSRSQARWQLTRDSRSIFHRETRSQKSEKIFFPESKKTTKNCETGIFELAQPRSHLLGIIWHMLFCKTKVFWHKIFKMVYFP